MLDRDASMNWLRRHAPRLGLLLLAIGVAALFVVNFCNGERIPYHDGLGWDGTYYADWARQDTMTLLHSHSVSDYYLTRLLPTIIIHNVAKLLHIEISGNPAIIAGFYIYNTICLLATLWLICAIGRLRGWTGPVTLTAVACLFFNFAVLKNASYNPTLTDMSALFCATLLVYAWLRRSLPLYLAGALAGCFVWPSYVYSVLPLLMFWRVRVGRTVIFEDKQGPGQVALRRTLAALLALGTVGGSLYLYFYQGFRLPESTNPVNVDRLWLSAPLMVGYIYLAVGAFTDPIYYLRALRNSDWRYWIPAGALFYAVKRTIAHFSSGWAGPLTPKTFVMLIAQGALVNPLGNIVAHLEHYGPVVALVILLWPRLRRSIRLASPGMAAIVCLYGFLAMGTESRQFLPLLPVLVYFVAEEINRLRPDWFFAWAVTGMALAMSRFWMTVNVGEWTGVLLNFPDQMLFMYSGPWMSNQMYAVFLAVDIIMAIAVWAVLRPYLRATRPKA